MDVSRTNSACLIHSTCSFLNLGYWRPTTRPMQFSYWSCRSFFKHWICVKVYQSFFLQILYLYLSLNALFLSFFPVHTLVHMSFLLCQHSTVTILCFSAVSTALRLLLSVSHRTCQQYTRNFTPNRLYSP